MNKFMKEAIRLAKIGMDKNNGGPFGAVIVYKDKIIGRGYNQVIATNDPTKHAEIVAISRASKYLKSFDLSKCELYATGEPGPMALAAIA
jgi:tRNA(Arg) A34 adenosine deaminase TadA